MAAPDAPAPIAYMERTRTYYEALGYGPPYRWAQHAEVPFAPIPRPLRSLTLGLVTTAAPFKPEAGDQGPGAPYNAAAKFYAVYTLPSDRMPDLRIAHVAIDRDHTTAEDIGTYLPLRALWDAAREGRIGRLSRRLYGLPTNRSQKTTREVDAPALLEACQADGVEAAVLVANCPVCHQSVSLAARALEAEGIATVIMGAARDIVEHAGVPRLLFSDVPLGNAAGLPGDAASQRATLALALELLDMATEPRTTAVNPLQWPGPADWRASYSNAARLSPAELAERRAAFDEGKRLAAGLREDRRG
ncbi:MAG: glycine reductase [Pseudomonadota bacterium]